MVDAAVGSVTASSLRRLFLAGKASARTSWEGSGICFNLGMHGEFDAGDDRGMSVRPESTLGPAAPKRGSWQELVGQSRCVR